MTSLSAQAFKEGVRGRFPMMEDASVLIRLLGELLESYLSVGKGLKTIGAQTVDQKALVQRLMKMAKAEASVFPESISIQNFGHAVKFFENLGQVTLNKTSDKAQVTILPWKPESETALVELARWMKLTETPAKDLLR